MGTVSTITIFVRHAADCKYSNEFEKRCHCRKHLRWTANGKQHRRKAGSRSWAEAETAKRDLEDQLAGRVSAPKTERLIAEAIKVFLVDKKIQGLTSGVLKRYTGELKRLQSFCERSGVFAVQGLTRELLTGYCATWEETYPASQTRASVRARLSGFLRYCYEAQWLERIPALPKVKTDARPTLPLSADEYTRLLDALYVVCPLDRKGGTQRSDGLTDAARIKLRALLQLMRYSGLAIGDATTLERVKLIHANDIYRVVTSRQKTGTDVSVPIPPEVAEDLIAVAAMNSNPKYIFWSGEGLPNTIGKMWANRYIRPLFEAAGLAATSGRMLSHRLRDTFAVDLLEKGVPMEEVSKALGHKSIKTTEKYYAKWVKGRQDRLDSLVMKTWDKPRIHVIEKRTA